MVKMAKKSLLYYIYFSFKLNNSNRAHIYALLNQIEANFNLVLNKKTFKNATNVCFYEPLVKYNKNIESPFSISSLASLHLSKLFL